MDARELRTGSVIYNSHLEGHRFGGASFCTFEGFLSINLLILFSVCGILRFGNQKSKADAAGKGVFPMHRIFRKSQIFTIPNLLSFVRLALIPLIVWLYVGKSEYYLAVGVILLSGATDIADGYIARHFNMVSDFGKILDPIADKLTQAALIICLTVKYDLMYGIIILFVIKEIIMGTMGLIAIRKRDLVDSSKWHGKFNTVVLYFVMLLLILFPNIPTPLANSMILLCCVTMILSLVLYVKFFMDRIRGK